MGSSTAGQEVRSQGRAHPLMLIIEISHHPARGRPFPFCAAVSLRPTINRDANVPGRFHLSVQSAVIMVQGTIRRCIAFGRVHRIRHRRRGQAQTVIARAARQRAVYVRQKELEEREREEANASTMAMMRVRYLMIDPEAPTCAAARFRSHPFRLWPKVAAY